MKICPECALANEERFPTCVVCHAPLADVLYTPSADPTHPEHTRRALERRRRFATQRQLWWAALCYILVIAGLAVFPGLVFDPEVAALYAASAAAVALAVGQDLLGTFLAGLLQGALSVTLFVSLGPAQPLGFYMLAGHVLTAMVLGHWVEMIHDANR